MSVPMVREYKMMGEMIKEIEYLENQNWVKN